MIEIQNLTKTFKVHKKEPGLKGSLKSLFERNWIEKKALNDVSFKIEEGEIVGLIGSNGAGKTTLAKIMSGIIHPTSGKCTVMGFNPWSRDNRLRKNMSLIMGQKASLWWDLPAWDCYLMLKEIYQISDKDFNERLEYLAVSLNIKDQLKVQIRRLSLGERMKVELIAALLHSPKVVFLDEPTIGLDLTAQRAVRKFILKYKEENSPAMVLTSHYMEDIEELCERIIILKEGMIVYDGPLDDVKNKYANVKVVTCHLNCEETLCNFDLFPKELGEVSEQTNSLVKIKCPRDKVKDTVAHMLATYPVHDISIEEVDVADIIEAILREGAL